MSVIIDFPKREDIKKMFDLDTEVFGKDITQDVNTELSIYEKWYDINKYQWLVAKDEKDNVVGYINVYHIHSKAFQMIIDGKKTERDFTVDDFVRFKQGNKVCCYIDGFVVKNKNTRVAIGLLNKFIRYFRFLKENGIFVEKIGTMAASNDGLKLCKKTGFKMVREYEELSNGVKSALYVLDMSDKSYTYIVNEIKDIFLYNDKFLR